jgi:hypothetical protein
MKTASNVMMEKTMGMDPINVVSPADFRGVAIGYWTQTTTKSVREILTVRAIVKSPIVIEKVAYALPVLFVEMRK